MRGALVQIVLAGLVLPSMVRAEAPLSIAPKPIADMSVEQVMVLLMKCTIRTKVGEQRAIAWSHYAPGDPSGTKMLRDIIASECVPVDRSGNVYGLTFNPWPARQALFETLYNKHEREIRFDTGDEAKLDLTSEFAPSNAVAEAVTLRVVGDCVVLNSKALVRNLLATEISSEAEKAALAELPMALGSCLPPGPDVKLNTAVVRGMLAEAMYKRFIAVRGATANAAGRS